MCFPPSDLPLTPQGSCTVRPGTSYARVLAGSLNKALGSEVLQKAGAVGTHARQGSELALGGLGGHASSPARREDRLCKECKQPRETMAALHGHSHTHAQEGGREPHTQSRLLLLSAPETQGEKSSSEKEQE